ncbi:MAG: hypothetical protein NT039_03185 [Candidatus Berkelbacteria bacterium]|nr:hypothetical protein [Candidatus Berkelbacteria bacterium]
MPERGPRDTSTGGGGGAPGEDHGPESGAEGTPTGSEPTRDESAAGGTEERAEEPREETPPEETPAPARETTPEAETGERIDWLDKVATETKEREDAFYKEKYGGRWGQLKKWLNETDAGKAVKIGTKIVAATVAGITAATLTGGTGLLLAPALYGLGMKSLVDGGIEAVSYLLKGRNLRIAIQGARHDMRESMEERFGELKRTREAGEIDEATFAERVAGLTKEIAQKEKEVIQKETDRMKWEKKEAMVRAIASTVASVGVMCFTGIPLGVQNFNAPEASHAVRFTWRGFEFIYNSSETMAKTVHGLAFGLKTHALGSFGSAANALGAYVGLGAAAVGMFATTAAQLRAAKTRGEIPSGDPRDISGAGEYGGRARRPEARRPGGGGPHRPTGGPGRTGHAPGGTPGAEVEGAPPPAAGGAAREGATEGEGAGARGGEGGEGGAAAEAERVTPEELRRFIAESGDRRTELIGSLEDIDSRLRVLDEEQKRIEDAGVKTPETETRIREIAEERARLEEQKKNIKTEIDRLDEIERTSKAISADADHLITVEGEYYTLDSKETKTEEDRRRMETLTEESKGIKEINEGRRESLREMVRVIKRRAAAGGEGGGEGAGGPAEEDESEWV